MEGHARTYGSGCASASILCGSETVDVGGDVPLMRLLGCLFLGACIAAMALLLRRMFGTRVTMLCLPVRNTRDDAVPACSNRWCFRVAFRL